MRNESTIGQVGEHLTAAVLLDLGVQTIISPTQGCDLIAYCGRRFWRIEVKTTTSVEPGRKTYRWATSRGSKQKIKLTDKECDIVALVAWPQRRVFFRHVDEVKEQLSTRLYVDLFVDGCERATWVEAIAWT